VRLGRNLREAAKHGGKGQGNRVLTPWGT